MDIIQSETNRDKKSVIFDDHTYRLSNVLKNGDKVVQMYQKKLRITIDADSKIVKTGIKISTIVLGYSSNYKFQEDK